MTFLTHTTIPDFDGGKEFHPMDVCVGVKQTTVENHPAGFS